jgi:arylsulfatase A-like enzyme
MSESFKKNGGGETSNGRARRVAPSAGVWTRIGLLFGVLCLAKVFLLLTFRKYLFEIHWRINSLAPSWLDEAAFYLFALLVGLNLWMLGVRCAAIGIRAMRTANFYVLGLGVAFIFLTFHAVDKNYLFSLMNGFLTWRNMGWYLVLNSCFGPPYLAVWMLAYAFGYYFLARTGREHWMLRVTAICAAAYTVLCLRDMMVNRNAMIAVDCVGTASFVASLAAGQRALRLLWVCLPLIGMGFLYALFIPFDNMLRHPSSEFILLSASSIILFSGVSLLVWRGDGYPAWTWGLPFALSSFLILVNTNYISAPNYNNFLTLGLALPHYFFGEFALAASLFVVAFCYRMLLPKASLWWLDMVNLILITLALADLRLSQIMGVRLDWQLLKFGNSPVMMWRLSRPYLSAFFGMLAALIVVYVIALLIIQKWRGRIIKIEKAPDRNGGGLFVLIGFILLGLAGWGFARQDKAQGQTAILLVKTNPLWQKAASSPMTREQLAETAHQLGIHLLATQVTATGFESVPRNLNVVLIFQESSYNKYLSLFNGTNDTQPLLLRYKDRMELFPNFFSNFAGSIYARFATFTGLYPVRDLKSFTQQRVPVKSIFEILHDQGYTCSLFDSCFFDYDDERDFLAGRGLDEMYDADTMPGPRKLPPVSWGLREEETLAAMQDQIKKYAAEKKKFFLTYAPVAPHNPFDAVSGRFRKYKMQKMGDFTPAYVNSLTYMDWIISSIIDQLKESGLLDKTLIVITDDHGEMLGENGGPVGHGWVVTPELANIPLIIMDPAKPSYSINDVVGSQVDLLPTILDRLNIRLPGGQIYEGTSLYSANLDTNRLIYLNSLEQYGVIQGRQLTCDSQEPETKDVKISSTTYVMSNHSAHTSFIQTNAPDFSLPSISQFDEFQENFLANYARYCQFLQTPVNNK